MIRLSGNGLLYRQLYDSSKKLIIIGEYQLGEKLPSSRELSKALVKLANEKSVGIYSANKLYEIPLEKLGLLIGYGNLNCNQIEVSIKRLNECYLSLRKDN